jgi:hypothetical protein
MKVTGNVRRVTGRLLGIALACVTFAGVARAQPGEPATIVLVSNHADAAIIPLLRAELANLGLNVLVVDRGDHELSPGELTEAARRNRAFAAFRVLVAQGKVEVWLADRVTGKVLLREVLKTPSQQSDTSESAVIARAVELLRASLLELDVDERPVGEVARPKSLPKALAPPGPRPSEPREPTPASFAINTSFVMLGASLRTIPSPGIGVTLRWLASPNIALQARIAAPVAGPEYSMPEGHTQLTPRLAAASLRLSTNPFNHGFRGSIESGIGVLWTRAVGVGEQGYTGFVANDVEPVPFLGGELSYNATHNIAFAIGLLGGPGLRPTKYLFTNEDAGSEKVIGRYGRWVGLASLGLDVAWN